MTISSSLTYLQVLKWHEVCLGEKPSTHRGADPQTRLQHSPALLSRAWCCFSLSVRIDSFKALALGFSGSSWRSTTPVLSLHTVSLHQEVPVLLEEGFIPLGLCVCNTELSRSQAVCRGRCPQQKIRTSNFWSWYLKFLSVMTHSLVFPPATISFQ